ncbi:MAG: RloB domain-containing protein [Candidatus Diapherotrites archaeon]|nr:RloB domain-containing protein [Candidatus Diapherotrites archaeon]
MKQAHDYAESKHIQIALSNPCFELWFILHYDKTQSKISRQEAIQKLKKFINDYKKNKNINDCLEDKQTTAIENAKFLNQMHKKENTPLNSTESNPSTQVFKLVEFIQALIEKNKLN